LGDLLFLSRLPTRRRHGKEPLMDYSNSHVLTSNQYLVVLRQKALEKKFLDNIREQKGKKNEIGLNIHLLQQKKQLKGMLKKNIELGSTMHGLL